MLVCMARNPFEPPVFDLLRSLYKLRSVEEKDASSLGEYRRPVQYACGPTELLLSNEGMALRNHYEI